MLYINSIIFYIVPPAFSAKGRQDFKKIMPGREFHLSVADGKHLSEGHE